MTRSFATRSAIAALLLWGPGCAAQSDNSGKQVREVTEQVRRLQSTTDRLEERLAALENSGAKATQRPPGVESRSSDLPNLPVVKVNPDSSTSPTEVRPMTGEGEEPRPLIVGEGSRVETRTGGGELPAANMPTRRSKDKPAVESTTSKRMNAATNSGKKSP